MPSKACSHAGRGLTDGAAFQDILEKAGAELAKMGVDPGKLLRHAGLREGRLFSPDALAEARARLYNLGLFSSLLVDYRRDAAKQGFGQAMDRLVITAGVPFGTPGATNVLRVARIGG